MENQIELVHIRLVVQLSIRVRQRAPGSAGTRRRPVINIRDGGILLNVDEAVRASVIFQ
ncbi:MAG: hypothetical protein M0Z84_05225 [Gammaproteobacteria bacterium]|nr:hypothetical protein [Gammaproteobacteria bacterium]